MTQHFALTCPARCHAHVHVLVEPFINIEKNTLTAHSFRKAVKSHASEKLRENKEVKCGRKICRKSVRYSLKSGRKSLHLPACHWDIAAQGASIPNSYLEFLSESSIQASAVHPTTFDKALHQYKLCIRFQL